MNTTGTPVDNLVSLVVRLAHALRKADQFTPLPDLAMGYLRHAGLAPSPLRTAQPDSGSPVSEEPKP